jgi:hypothetical protein
MNLISISYNRPGTYQLQKSATEHSSTCKSHSHKLQQAKYLSVTEEHYWAIFYMQVSFPQAQYLSVTEQRYWALFYI